MSYLDSTASVYQNLSPEDAEHLLTRSADNMGYIGHSDSTGWGALDAGRSLQSVNKRCTELVHLGKGNTANITGVALSTYTPIKLTERYVNPSGQTFDTITYLCTVIKAINPMSQSLDPNYVITDYWTRPSSTTLLLLYDSVSHTLAPYEHLYIDTISPTSITVSGFYYEVYSAIDSSYLGNWGISDTAITDSMRFDYTLLLTNPTVSRNPIDTTTGIKKPENQMNVLFYPNPVEDEGILQIFTDGNTKATIEIIDQQGRTIETVYSGDISNGINSFSINTKSLTSGLYLIIINSGEGNKTIKFTKI